jgi:hypothetical protein
MVDIDGRDKVGKAFSGVAAVGVGVGASETVQIRAIEVLCEIAYDIGMSFEPYERLSPCVREGLKVGMSKFVRIPHCSADISERMCSEGNAYLLDLCLGAWSVSWCISFNSLHHI